MKRLIGIALVVALVATTKEAQAQRRGKSGPAMTPFGPVVNPGTSPEWKQAGGNPVLYQAIMEQKAQAARMKIQKQQEAEFKKQQAAMKKQKDAFDKWVKEQKANKEKGKPVDPAYQRMLDQDAQMKATAEAKAAKAAAKKTKKTATTKKATGG